MRRRTVAGLAASLAAVALVVTASIVWPGLDAQETPEVDTAVWALQTGEGQRYARVNTAVGELDTVRTAGNPSQVAQGADGAYLFTDSYSKITRIDEAQPIDLQDEQLEAAPETPPGTTSVVTAGDYVVYRTDTGTLFASRLSRAGQAATELDPFGTAGDDEAPAYTADAMSLDDRGILFAYSSADDSVIRYDIEADELKGRDALEVQAASPVLSAAGDDWVLVDADDGRVWVRGREAIELDTADQLVIAEPDPRGRTVYLADEQSLWSVPVDGPNRGARSGPAETSSGSRPSRSRATASRTPRGFFLATRAGPSGARMPARPASTTPVPLCPTSAGRSSSRRSTPSSSTKRARGGSGPSPTGRSWPRARAGVSTTARRKPRSRAMSS